MKLKTKIIPLTALATTSAIVAPISLASCGSGSVIGSAFDLARPYLPKMERHQKTTLSKHDINELYANQLLNYPETFVKDYMWAKSWDGSAFDQLFFWQQLFPDQITNNIDSLRDPHVERNILGSSTFNYKKDIESISHLSISFTQQTIGDEVWTIPLMSFTLKFNSSVDDIFFVIEDEDCTVSLSGNVAGEIKLLNVPFWITTHYVYELQYERNKFVVSFEPNYFWMFGLGAEDCPQWRIEFSISSSLSGQIEYSTHFIERVADDWNFNKIMNNGTFPWVYRSLSYQENFNNVFTTSFYLERVSCSDI